MNEFMTRRRKVKEANKIFLEIFKSKEYCFLIHYSCENFIDNQKSSNRITSIAVRNLNSGQTDSFSIFQYAEKLQIQPQDVKVQYDLIEKNMLNDFFTFLEKNQSSKYIHWNMRNVNYGFKAIEHRGEILNCHVFYLNDSKKYDLSRLLKLRFSRNYIEHTRLRSIAQHNDITTLNFLTGKQEADAFDNNEFKKLHLSTLRKVHIFEDIISRVEDNKLKTKATLRDIWGLNCTNIINTIKEHPITVFLGIIILIITFIMYLLDLFDLLHLYFK